MEVLSQSRDLPQKDVFDAVLTLPLLAHAVYMYLPSAFTAKKSH